MAVDRIVVIGGSAGAVEVVKEITSRLPRELAAAVLVVIHIGDVQSELPTILSRHGALPARHARDGEAMKNGQIYIAPPNLHMMVDGDRLRLTSGARENRQRPALDPLFRSAAQEYGNRVIGVVLTGYLDDGSAGLLAVKEHGGTTIVQEPETAFAADMPANAIDYVKPEYVVPWERIPGLIGELTSAPLPAPRPVEADHKTENRIVELDMSKIEDERRPGKPSPYACPECHGVLWEMEEGKMLRFRCRVGHAYSPANLETAQREAIEDALWAALRGLEERASLAGRMGERAQRSKQKKLAERYQQQSEDRRKHARVIRELLAEAPEKHSAA